MKQDGKKMAEVSIALPVPDLIDLRKPQRITGSTPREVLANLVNKYPKLKDRIWRTEGSLHAHVIVYLNGKLIKGNDIESLLVTSESKLEVFAVFAGG
jgi:hypothetical protein